MILVRNLRKSFGARRVLDGLDLDVESGAVTLLVGSNGAGKTTTLRLVAGLAKPDAGTVAIAGHDLFADRHAALAQLSFLPQSPRFHPRLTVRETAGFYAQLRGRRAEVDSAIDLWGLSEHARVPTGKLSGGLRQRLALAIITLADAPVLLLDEPGLSLDPEWRQHLQDFLAAEAARGCTVLVATHLLGEWEGRTDRCILVENGVARGDLPPDRIRDWFPMAAATPHNGSQCSVALRVPVLRSSTSEGGSAGTNSLLQADMSRSSRSGLHSDPVALRGSAGTDSPSLTDLSRSSRSGLRAEPCA